jgi:hypothetical protein
MREIEVGGGSLKMTVGGAPCGVIRFGDGVPVQSATWVSDDHDVEQECRGQKNSTNGEKLQRPTMVRQPEFDGDGANA